MSEVAKRTVGCANSGCEERVPLKKGESEFEIKTCSAKCKAAFDKDVAFFNAGIPTNESVFDQHLMVGKIGLKEETRVPFDRGSRIIGNP